MMLSQFYPTPTLTTYFNKTYFSVFSCFLIHWSTKCFPRL
jgi:hypothetical protein